MLSVEIRYVGPKNRPLTKEGMMVIVGNPIPSVGDIVQIDGDIWRVEGREIAIQDGATNTVTIHCEKPGQS